MSVPKSQPSSYGFVEAALLAGTLIAATFVVLSWSRLYLMNRLPAGIVQIAQGILIDWLVAIIVFVPFLLAALLVIADPSRRAVIHGTALIYVVELLLAGGQAYLRDLPVLFYFTILAVPLPEIAIFLGVATAIWLVYHGGYERLVSALGTPDPHPIFVHIADTRIGPGIPLQPGIVGAGLGGLVTAGGLVLVGTWTDLLRAVARSRLAGPAPSIFLLGQVWDVGIPPVQLPVEWLGAASFLLAVLFVTSHRPKFRDFLKGIVVIFGVQTMVHLLPSLFPPSRAVHVWDAPGPVFEPIGDAIQFAGITIAVWLSFHDRLKPLHHLLYSRSNSDD